MKRKKFLSCLLAMAVAAGTFVPMTANAQTVNGEPVATILPSEDSQVEGTFPSKETQTANYKGNNEISTISIGELDAPQEGKLLDFSAVVNTDNGAAWKIPVIWSDEDGNLTTVKSSKVNSYPVFAFYMPKGYTIKDAQTITDRIELPQAAKDIYAGRKVVKIVDPKTGWVFITCLDGPGKNLNVEAAAADFADIVKQFGEAEKANHGQSNDGGSQENSTVNQIPELSREQQLLAMHCDENAINTIGAEKLAALVELIRYTIEPQAVNFLLDGFPCFNEAMKNGELSSNIGFYVYYENALMPDDNFIFSNEEFSSAIAYVQPYYSYEDGRSYLSVAVNAAQVLKYNGETNEWEMSDSDRVLLENTLAHEMLHAFMFDYTASGMNGIKATENGLSYYSSTVFPSWFKEGIATAVEDGYRFRINGTSFYGNSEGNGYDVNELISSYDESEGLQLYYGETVDDQGGDLSRYATGYLACMYLSYLASNDPIYREKYNIQGNANETIDSQTYVINSEPLKQGLNAILSEIHGHMNENGEWESASLDDVIGGLLGNQGINSTDQFQERFIKDLPDSADFCVDLLNYYNYFSSEDGAAVGSILLPADSTQKSVLEGVSTEGQNVYTIVDTEISDVFVPQFMESDAQNKFLDGAKTYVDSSEDIEDNTQDNQAAANAAKTDSTTTEGEE